MTSPKRKLGDLCEGLAVKHLVKQGFSIIERNYSQKWGELDIIARDKGVIHFIEVKGARLGEGGTTSGYRPEENVHSAKRRRMWRAIQTWLSERRIPDETEWQVDVMAVFLDFGRKKAKIRWTKNIILGE